MKTVALFICFAAALQAQFVEGSVYDAITGAPLSGASVGQSTGINPTVARTDASGHFRVQVQPNNQRNVMAVKSGYLPGGIQLTDNAQAVRIELKPEAVITGKISDEDGFPAGDGQVMAMRYQMSNGRQTLGFAGLGRINELGEYRIDSLTPGRYYLHAQSYDARNWDARYIPQFLGGTLQPDDSHMVEVKTGELRKDVDIRLVRFEGVTVSGRVEGVTLDPHVSAPLVGLVSDQAVSGPGFQTFSRGEDTTFTIHHVPPGTYKLAYGQSNPRAGDLVAQSTVEVGDHDVSGLVVSPHAVQPVDLQGQVVAREGGSPGQWMVYLRLQSNMSVVSARMNPDGSFVLPGLMPQHYSVQTTPDMRESQGRTPPGHVVSIMLGDRDVMQKGFDLDGAPLKPLRIVVSTQYAAVSGTIVDSHGVPLANTAVFFRAQEPTSVGYSMTNDKGMFQAWLPEAGDYHVYTAVDQAEIADRGEEAYFKAHQSDFPVLHLVLGENAAVRLAQAPRSAQ